MVTVSIWPMTGRQEEERGRQGKVTQLIFAPWHLAQFISAHPVIVVIAQRSYQSRGHAAATAGEYRHDPVDMTPMKSETWNHPDRHANAEMKISKQLQESQRFTQSRGTFLIRPTRRRHCSNETIRTTPLSWQDSICRMEMYWKSLGRWRVIQLQNGGGGGQRGWSCK